MKHAISKLLFAFGLAASSPFPAVHAQEESISIPNLSYRTGPFASSGVPVMNGQRDYITLINDRDGGLNGVALHYAECETGYHTQTGIECYGKAREKAVALQLGSTDLMLKILPGAEEDRVPILSPGYGPSAISDGRIFRWAFNPPLSYWDGVSMILSHISDGALGNFNGKRIAFLYLDNAFGRDPLPLLERLSEKHGFELLRVPVGLTEMQNQSDQWQRISREQPDFVLMWGWGAMNAGAIAEAVRTGYPMDRLIGIWSSGNEADLQHAGKAGEGYRSLTWNIPNSGSPLMGDIRSYVVERGKSLADLAEGELDSVFYQRGLMISAILVEAILLAQERFDSRIPRPEQVRWGLENLAIDEARLAELGMAGMLAPFKTSCTDHTGHGGGWMLEWNGEEFVKASGLLTPDRAELEPLEKEAARSYAEANAPWPVEPECSP